MLRRFARVPAAARVATRVAAPARAAVPAAAASRRALHARRPARMSDEDAEVAEKIDEAKARRMEKAREIAEERAAARREEEVAKQRQYEAQKEEYFKLKPHLNLKEDVRYQGGHDHLPEAELRRMMLEADKDIAITPMPPVDFMPELYSGTQDNNIETALTMSAADEAHEHSIHRGHKPTAEQGVPEEYDQRQLRKYGFKLPEIVHIHSSWTKKKISTGSLMKRKTLLVAGNGKGVIGWGVGKSTDNYQAWMTAYSRCLENALFVPLSEGRTLPHPVVGKFKRTRVVILPAPRGTGITAGRNIYPILASAGVEDAVTKVVGRRNPYNVVLAVFDGLRQLVSRQDMAEGRGKKVYDFLDPGDYHLVSPTEAEMEAQFDKAGEAIHRAMELSARLRQQMRRDADAEAKEELAEMAPEELKEELSL